MKFKRLSSNLVTIIGEVLKNQKLVNYIGHTGDNPSSVRINPSKIAPNGDTERVFPYPFDITFKEDVRTQLHIYYPNIKFESNGHAGRTFILFDIVVHKKIWLATDDKEKVIRPYEIATLIFETFKDKHVEGLGELVFVEGDHISVNEEFEGFRIVATTTDF